TRDYYALAGYLQSSRMDRAFIDDPEPREKILKRMETLKAELMKQSRDAAAVELEKRLDELAAKAVQAMLGDGKKNLSAEEFKAKRQAALAAMKAQAERASTANAASIVFADAERGGFADWFQSGDAYSGEGGVGRPAPSGGAGSGDPRPAR